jgi:hypothetical protein
LFAHDVEIVLAKLLAVPGERGALLVGQHWRFNRSHPAFPVGEGLSVVAPIGFVQTDFFPARHNRFDDEFASFGPVNRRRGEYPAIRPSRSDGIHELPPYLTGFYPKGEATDDAKSILQSLAKGNPKDPVVREAKAALSRIGM